MGTVEDAGNRRPRGRGSGIRWWLWRFRQRSWVREMTGDWRGGKRGKIRKRIMRENGFALASVLFKGGFRRTRTEECTTAEKVENGRESARSEKRPLQRQEGI